MIVAGFAKIAPWHFISIAAGLTTTTKSLSPRWQYGRDLVHLCFPQAAHDEKVWAVRLHLPLQLFAGIVGGAPHTRSAA